MGRRKVSIEEQELALEEIRKGRAVADVAQQFEVSPQAVYLWVANSRKSKTHEDEGLNRRLERLENEVDYLKKDIAFIKEDLAIIKRQLAKKH